LLDKLAFLSFFSRGGATSDGAGTKEANEGQCIQNGNRLETGNESGEDSFKDEKANGGLRPGMCFASGKHSEWI
jgi:hypothetical protein